MVRARSAKMIPMALRAMTWNLWWRFGSFELRQRAILRTIRTVDPDVICLQETWTDDAASGQADLIAAELGFHAAREANGPADGHGFGNAVLARWPIVRQACEQLPDEHGEPGHRDVVLAVVDTPYGPWPFGSTHLDHRFDRSATRRRQATRLLELAADWRGDPERDLPVIVGADLNAVPDADEVRLLTGRRPGVGGIVLSDAWEQARPGADGATWRAANPYSADSAWPNRRLDYLLVSWPRPKPVGNPRRAWLAGTRPVDVGGEAVWPSDHAAVVAEFVTPPDRARPEPG